MARRSRNKEEEDHFQTPCIHGQAKTLELECSENPVVENVLKEPHRLPRIKPIIDNYLMVLIIFAYLIIRKFHACPSQSWIFQDVLFELPILKDCRAKAFFAPKVFSYIADDVIMDKKSICL